MKARLLLIALALCISAGLLLPPSAHGQTAVVKITADFPIISIGPATPILGCDEALRLSGPGGNLGTTKAVADPLTLVKKVNYQSAALRRLMTEGTRMPEVMVHFTLLYSDGGEEPLLDITLYDSFIPEIRLTSGNGPDAVEAVKLQFPRACWVSYSASAGTVTQCWNFETNKPFSKP